MNGTMKTGTCFIIAVEVNLCDVYLNDFFGL